MIQLRPRSQSRAGTIDSALPLRVSFSPSSGDCLNWLALTKRAPSRRSLGQGPPPQPGLLAFFELKSSPSAAPSSARTVGGTRPVV